MEANRTDKGELLASALEALTLLLPDTWHVERQPVLGDAELADIIINTPGGSQSRLFVELKSSVSTRDVEALLGGPWRRWRRQMGNPPILLVAPYINPRVRQLLTEENVSYIDLTGNTRIRIDPAGIFVESNGASQDPNSTRQRSGIRGAKAGSVVRVLADARPPYTATEVAKAAGVNEGYLSRILETLVSEGLVDRDRGGPISRVDWAAMIQRRAQTLNLFRSAGSYRYIARQGPSALLDRLRDRTSGDSTVRPTVTGSFAAAKIAPVAAPALLVIYTTEPRELANELQLLPAEAGADTVLIRPDNDVAFARARLDGGMAWAAPSQVAIDCLAGSGRMPSEGEALIGWMREHENEWRRESIQSLPTDHRDRQR